MLFYPNAKINLGLNVINKRADGFHDIETVFVPVPELCDILEVTHSDSFSVEVMNADFEDTLCTKAWELMHKEFAVPPVRIGLYKNIPAGAGLGGGSADAAFTLSALNLIFSLGLSRKRLAALAAGLGSDCPFFIYNRPMFAKGRGEILTQHPLTQAKLEGHRVKVVPQDVFVSTKEAYDGVTPHKPSISLEDVLQHPIEEWKDFLVNDFEESVFKKYPSISRAKNQLYEEGAIYASMSGSGSAVYGIF